MKNEKLFFYITKYTNGTYRVETPDIRYHWRDGLLKDEIKPEKLGTVLEKMAEDARNKYELDALFEFRYIYEVCYEDYKKAY